MPAAPAVSIVICSRDRPQFLEAALAALGPVPPASPGASAVEAVVVDSASTTLDTGRVATAAGWRVVRVERPGLARARNAGVAATSGEVIAFTDDDCLPSATWPQAAGAAFADPRVGVVVGRLRPATEAGVAPGDDLGDTPFTFDATAHVDKIGVGANMAFRREALAAIGGFDELLGAGAPMRSAEDHDAVWRVLRAGWLGRYAADAVVLHQDWRPRLRLLRMQYGYGVGAGAFGAKVARIDPVCGWALLRRRVWNDGLASAATNLAKRWEGPAAADVLFTVGVVAGAARAWRVPLNRGRFASDR